MRGFFKTFFAALLAMIIFGIICILLMAGFLAGLTSPERPFVGSKAVLVLNLSNTFKEQNQGSAADIFTGDLDNEEPSLYDMVRLIRHAVSDSSVKGMYIQCANNPNDFAASEELREAIKDFRKSKKFVIAYGETITQKGYYIGSLADKIYCHPQGGVDWSGFSADLAFLKGTLDKLDIRPQIFYAGKFKSATEPLRETKMTDANRLQTSVWLGDLYAHFLQAASESRKIDTATLHALANNGTIQTAADAWHNRLIDGLKYDDEVKQEITDKLHISNRSNINFVTFSDYSKAESWRKTTGDDRIAIVYADGDIVSGSGGTEQVGSDAYRNIIRRLRLDKNVKAIVFRVNSPGGSSLASDVIWRELSITRKEKPVIVSMGGVAASGGYYISCNADSVFANPGTITGSIGVFSIVPNMSEFFRNKLGITFDGVKTAQYADMGSSDRPLTETEKRFIQASVDSIYGTFKSRVAEGRKKDTAYVSSIAQGRIWTGSYALNIGLVDRIGTLQDAVDCAARMVKSKSYSVREYPEKKTLLQQLLNNYKKSVKQDLLKNEIGEEQLMTLKQLKQVKQMIGTPQARLPFTFQVR